MKDSEKPPRIKKTDYPHTYCLTVGGGVLGVKGVNKRFRAIESKNLADIVNLINAVKPHIKEKLSYGVIWEKKK